MLDEQAKRKVREYRFTDAHFARLCELVFEHVGISLSESKCELVYGRLVHRLRKLGLEGFDDYLALITSGDVAELEEFTNALTTNLTSFFREGHHFDYLANTLLPEIAAETPSRRLRIWSAGCSTGEEPYSIAMVLAETLPDIERWGIRILATDVDTKVLSLGESGIYDEERITGISEQRRKRWFRRGRANNAGKVRVVPELRRMISFRQLNLLHDWPMGGPSISSFAAMWSSTSTKRRSEICSTASRGFWRTAADCSLVTRKACTESASASS